MIVNVRLDVSVHRLTSKSGNPHNCHAAISTIVESSLGSLTATQLQTHQTEKRLCVFGSIIRK